MNHTLATEMLLASAKFAGCSEQETKSALTMLACTSPETELATAFDHGVYVIDLLKKAMKQGEDLKDELVNNSASRYASASGGPDSAPRADESSNRELALRQGRQGKKGPAGNSP